MSCEMVNVSSYFQPTPPFPQNIGSHEAQKSIFQTLLWWCLWTQFRFSQEDTGMRYLRSGEEAQGLAFCKVIIPEWAVQEASWEQLKSSHQNAISELEKIPVAGTVEKHQVITSTYLPLYTCHFWYKIFPWVLCKL